MNDISATSQAFIDRLLAQLHGFRFISLLQPRTLIIVNGKVVTLDLITYFITIQLTLKDKSRRIHTKTLDLFSTKLSQYPIIFGLSWFEKDLPHIRFDKNTVTFDFPHYLQHYSSSHQAVTVSGLNISFDHLSCLSTLSDQAVKVFGTDDFILDPYSHLLSYYRCHPRHSPHQAVNVSSIDKPTNCPSRSKSLSTSNLNPIGVDTPWSQNLHPRYFENVCYRLNMADSHKTMNQELLRPKD